MTFREVVERLRAVGPEEPRVVISGNSANPVTLIEALLAARERCRVFQLNAHDSFTANPALHHRDTLRRTGHAPRLHARLPAHAAVAGPPAVQHGTTGRRGADPHFIARAGKVSLGIEVNILPAAIEQARARGGLVIAQMNPLHAVHARGRRNPARA